MKFDSIHGWCRSLLETDKRVRPMSVIVHGYGYNPGNISHPRMACIIHTSIRREDISDFSISLPPHSRLQFLLHASLCIETSPSLCSICINIISIDPDSFSPIFVIKCNSCKLPIVPQAEPNPHKRQLRIVYFWER